MTQPASHTRKWTHRRGVRVGAAFVLAAAMLFPLLFLFAQFWRATGEDAAFVREERRGVAYLRPLTQLLGTLTDAQSAVVNGREPEVTGVRARVASVDGIDREEGGALQAQQRWTQLQTRIDSVVTRKFTKPEDGYRAYSEVIDLTVDLMLKIGDTSNLILDPEVDSYYLMDAALLRLPQVLVNGGRVADLAVLGQRPDDTGDATPGTGNTGTGQNGNVGTDDRNQTGQDDTSTETAESVRIAVARDRVATATSAIDTGLRKSFDATDSETLGRNLLGPLDAFRSAATAIAPSSALLEVPEVSVNLKDVLAARDRLHAATLQFADTVLVELDELLAARADRLDAERITAPVAVVLGALVAAVILWLRLPRTEPVRPEIGVLEPDLSDQAFEPSVEPRDERVPARPEDYELLDARDLLAAVELVRVGRAVKPRPQEPDDDSQ